MKTALILTLLALTAPAFATMTPSDLRCEMLTNPLGIDAVKPRLSWVLSSDRRADKQTAYQVLVASSEQSLARDRGDIWDTGRVKSDASNHIEYAGKPLTTGQRVVWKVRVWDKDGKVSQPDRPASWEMGLLTPSDWKGTWIGRTTEKAYTPAPMLRKEFTVGGKVKRARAYICGLGYYELSLNGRKVGDRVRDPGYTRFDRRDLYATYDVTSNLKEGHNAVGVLLGTGWYNFHTLAVWYFDKAPWRAAPKVLMNLRLEYEDGRTETVSTDPTWKTSTGPIVYDSVYSGETYDALLKQVNWDTPGFDDSKWQQAIEVPPPGGKLVAQAMPPVKVVDTITPVKITEPKQGVFIVDMGQNCAGHARLMVKGPTGTEVTLRYSDRLNPDGTLDMGPLSPHVIKTNPPQRVQTDKYILSGQGIELWEPRFSYNGFQYVEVTGFPGKPERQNVQGRVVCTSVQPVSDFRCSNELLNRIWRATRWSYLSNLQSIPTDCPHREKNGWTGDAHLAAEQGLFNFDSAAVYEKWINDLDDEMRPTGELPGIVPSSGWGYEWGNGPAWDSAFLLIPWYVHHYTGDTRILTSHYEKFKRYVDYLTTRAKDGIVSIGLGDWVPYKTETPVPVTSTGYYYVDTVIVSKVAEMMGNQADAKKYADLAASIKAAFNRQFVNKETGNVANGSQTALSCALYQDLLDPEVRPRTLARLVEAVEKTNGHIDTGILGAKYLLNGLNEMGKADVAYRVASQKDMPSWGYWLERGGTTLWESWQGEGDSRNHIMFGDVSAWFFKTLAGINADPAAPGFKHFVVKPQLLGYLTHARASYNSVRGTIESGWERTGDQLKLTVAIPANTTATVYVPAADASKVTEGGKPAAQVEGVKLLRSEPGYAVFEVGSGRYEFGSQVNAVQPMQGSSASLNRSSNTDRSDSGATAIAQVNRSGEQADNGSVRKMYTSAVCPVHLTALQIGKPVFMVGVSPKGLAYAAGLRGYFPMANLFAVGGCSKWIPELKAMPYCTRCLDAARNYLLRHSE